MKITVNASQQIEIEAIAPRFWLNRREYSAEYVGWLDKDTVFNIMLDDKGKASCILLDTEVFFNHLIGRAYSTFEEITEEEFLAVHEAALNSLSLVPRVTENSGKEIVLLNLGDLAGITSKNNYHL